MHVLLLHHVVEDRWPSNSRWFLPSFYFFCTAHGILHTRILEWVAIPLLQGIFPTQGLNPGLPHCRQILYQLSHRGSPKILALVAYLFSRGSSQPRNWTRVSWIEGDSSPSELSFPGDAVVKNLPAYAGDTSLITVWGKYPGGGIGNLLQYSCLEKPMDRVAWWATVHGATKSRAWLSDWAHTYTNVQYSFECLRGYTCKQAQIWDLISDFKEMRVWLRIKGVYDWNN